MKLKSFIDFYRPVDGIEFRLAELSEKEYLDIEKSIGLMPGQVFQALGFRKEGIQISTIELNNAFGADLYIGWIFIEPVCAQERDRYRNAINRWCEYRDYIKEIAATHRKN